MNQRTIPAWIILFTVMCRPGHVVPSNTHFDTTRPNIEFTGAPAVDLPWPGAADTQLRLAFKGNMDVAALEKLIAVEGPVKIPLVQRAVLAGLLTDGSIV